VTPVEFRGDLWLQKTRVPGLSCGVVCVILRLAVLVEHRLVTDRQTDGRTDRQTQGHGLYRGCIASRGKNHQFLSRIRQDAHKRKLVPFFLPHGVGYNKYVLSGAFSVGFNMTLAACAAERPLSKPLPRCPVINPIPHTPRATPINAL